MALYSAITIIYNPNSTGPGKKLASELYRKLRTTYPNSNVQLMATEYAGHAEELTYELALKHDSPLIVSVSGDGGYHEVINGAAKAYAAGANPVTGLLPAGNANDHHMSVNNADILARIQSQKIKHIDLLRLTAIKASSKVVERQAHSYIGFGMSPRIGKELTRTKLNRVTEALVVFKGIFKPHVTHLVIDGKKQAFDSLTVSNIDRMAKVLKLGKNSSVDDGLFEVALTPHKHRYSLLSFIFRATTTGIVDSIQTDSFELRTTKRTLVQLDGEVITLPAKAIVQITISKQLLRCI